METGAQKRGAGRHGAASRPARTSALDRAFALLAARAMPEGILRQKLVAAHAPDEVEAALARLRELGLVDDAAWAARYAEKRFAEAGRGRHRIRAELVARGVAAEVADAAVAGLPSDEAERERAVRVLESMQRSASSSGGRVRKDEGDDPGGRESPGGGIVERQRLFRRMVARGWPASLVRDLLEVS